MKKASIYRVASFENMQPELNGSINDNLFVELKHQKKKGVPYSLASLLIIVPEEVMTSEQLPQLANTADVSYLNDMAPCVQRYNLQLQIKDQHKAVNKSLSRYNHLLKEDKHLQRKKINTEGKIQKNQHELQMLTVEIEAKKHLLAASLGLKDKDKQQQQTILKV